MCVGVLAGRRQHGHQFGTFSQHSHQHTRQANVASVLCGGSTEFQDELSSTAGKPYQVRARIYMRPF